MNAADEFRHWSSVRRGLLDALHMLGDEQLAFVPRDGLWSLGKVARHIAEAEEGWFRYVVSRELAGWPEFPDADSPTVDSVCRLLEEVHSRTEAMLRQTSPAELARVVEAPWDEEFPLRWVVWHVLEHEIHHRGEIYLMLGLMGMEAPDV